MTIDRIPRWPPDGENSRKLSTISFRKNDQGGRICDFKKGEYYQGGKSSKGQVRLEN